MITGHIYYICYYNEIVYTGSTEQSLNKRLTVHRCDKRAPFTKFMKEKGKYNFTIHLIETVQARNAQHLAEYEGMWQETLEELGCKLQNKYKAGNGSSNVYGSMAYDNNQKRKKEKIKCPLCGYIGSRGKIRRHQRSANRVPKS